MKQIIKYLYDLAFKNKKEDFYNNKYPQKDILYLGRVFLNKRVKIDVRDFFVPYDSQIKDIFFSEGLKKVGTDDELAYLALMWVIENIKYVSDSTQTGYNEYWQFPYETLNSKKGDCEDGAILLANIMLHSGIPYWKIRLTAGNITNGGHAYVTYYCEELDKWVVLDWCYYPNDLYINQRKDYKDEENYKDVWFSWNYKYSFSEGLNKEADKLLK